MTLTILYSVRSLLLPACHGSHRSLSLVPSHPWWVRGDKPAPGEEFPGISLRAEPRAVLPWDSVPAELHPEREMGEKEGFGVGLFFFLALFLKPSLSPSLKPS